MKTVECQIVTLDFQINVLLARKFNRNNPFFVPGDVGDTTRDLFDCEDKDPDEVTL